MEQAAKKLIQEKRVEEVAMSQKIYKKMRILAMTYPHSNEFRQLLKKNIFLENNSTAVLHILHFLFTIHDPDGSKKRLVWPCYEKTQEATARKQFVVFLNEINEKHKLDFEQATTFLLLKPTGTKFLTMIDKVILFVMLEQIKRSRSNWMDYTSRTVDLKQLPKLILEQQRQGIAFKEYKRKLTTKIEEATMEVQELSSLLQRSISGTAFSTDDPFTSGLIENYQLCLKNSIRDIRHFIAQNDIIINIGEHLQDQMLRSSDEHNTNAIVKEITESVDAIKNYLVDDTIDEVNDVLENKCINLNSLIQLLRKLEDKLLNYRDGFPQHNVAHLNHERKVLAEMVVKAKALRDSATIFETQLKCRWNRVINMDEDLQQPTYSSEILDNIILTPNITFKFNVKQKMSRHLQRLALANETFVPDMNDATLDGNESVMDNTVMEQPVCDVAVPESMPKSPPRTPGFKSVGARVLSMLKSNSKRTQRAFLENMNNSIGSFANSSVSESFRHSPILQSSPMADVSVTLKNLSRNVVEVEYSKQTSPSGRLRPLVEYDPEHMRHALNWSDCSDDVSKAKVIDKENDATVMNMAEKPIEEKSLGSVFDKSLTGMESILNISGCLLD